MQRYAEQLILFSKSQQQPLAPPSPNLASPLPPSSSPLSPSSSHTSTSSPLFRTPPKTHSSPYAHTGPARAMGAIDAYGGTVAPDRTPNMRAVRAPPSSHSTHTFARHHNYTARDDDASSIVSTDTETTETEGGDTTDDEPTIRPPNSGSSCCGDALEDTASEGVFQANGTRDSRGGENELQSKSMERSVVDSPPGMESDGDRGDMTPELRVQRRVREVNEDIGMTSP